MAEDPRLVVVRDQRGPMPGYPIPGQRVEMLTVKHAGRVGAIVRHVWIEGGGQGPRMAVLVRLDATKRAAEREVRCWESSYRPVDRVEWEVVRPGDLSGVTFLTEGPAQAYAERINGVVKPPTVEVWR
jgi:hypothetical protein